MKKKIDNEKKELFLIKLIALIVLGYYVQNAGKKLINKIK